MMGLTLRPGSLPPVPQERALPRSLRPSAALVAVLVCMGCAGLPPQQDATGPDVTVEQLAFPQPVMKPYGVVHFGHNSAVLDAKGCAFGDQLAAYLKCRFDDRVRLEGHASSSGAASYNRALAQGRADAVKDRLVVQGIEATRIEAVGLGETEPISSNDAENRRVEVILMTAVVILITTPK